jgi:hypothetical protein
MPKKSDVHLTNELVDGLKPQQKPYERRDSEVGNFLVRVQPSGAKTFYFFYRLAGGRMGKQRRYRIGSFPAVSVDGARRIARRIAGEIASGVDVQARKRAERARGGVHVRSFSWPIVARQWSDA